MAAEKIVNGKRYVLTFEDTFEGSALDTAKWSLCPETRRQDIGGRWRDDLTEVRDGNLILWAKLDEDGTPVSGAIRSMGKFEQAYGYFECRMKMHRTTGFWGAFWMMCGQVGKVDGSAVSGVEIDIIESGERARGGVNHALHWDGYGDAHKSVSKVIHAPELYEGWHTYALQWTADEYVFYIDDTETWRTSEPGICVKPGYLKLTTEFGSWAAPIVKEELPDCVRADWVRVYREA
ncbi:MAG: family 16 glycosylhydrolase [Eubacteriales bacterium]